MGILTAIHGFITGSKGRNEYIQYGQSVLKNIENYDKEPTPALEAAADALVQELDKKRLKALERGETIASLDMGTGLNFSYQSVSEPAAAPEVPLWGLVYQKVSQKYHPGSGFKLKLDHHINFSAGYDFDRKYEAYTMYLSWKD
jgi:hypothetical protein